MGLYILSVGTILIIAALAIVFLLYRTVDVLERIAAAVERRDARDRGEGS